MSALGFGGFFVLMAAASGGGIGWALLASRATAVVVLLAVGVGAPARSLPCRRPSATRRAVPGLVLVGALIVVADAAYAAATEVGPLGVVAVLGALHTVVTVGLAGAVLGERVGRVQAVGIAAALAGAAVVVVG